MHIVESFVSIEGEGKRVGELATFIRIAGCNFKKTPCWGMCDTPYGLDVTDGEDMSISEVVHLADRNGIKNVTITGGEPLMTKNGVALIRNLSDAYQVNVETNGSMDIAEIVDYFRGTPHGSFVTMDWKGASSGNQGRMLPHNLLLLRETDVLKFVIGADKDLHDMLALIRQVNIKAQIYVGPLFGTYPAEKIVAFMEKNNMQQVKLQVQLHKIVWDPEKRGV